MAAFKRAAFKRLFRDFRGGFFPPEIPPVGPSSQARFSLRAGPRGFAARCLPGKHMLDRSSTFSFVIHR